MPNVEITMALMVMVSIITRTYTQTCSERESYNNKKVLTNSEEDNNENNKPRTETNENGKGKKSKNRCCPYDFDSTLCKIVDDRVLCGYNRNKGQPKSKQRTKSLPGGCRLKGKRLECGYVQAPFTNIRRPPGWDKPPPDFGTDTENSKDNEDDTTPEVRKRVTESIPADAPDAAEAPDDENEVKTLKLKNTTPDFGGYTRCVEINERIVCTKIQ